MSEKEVTEISELVDGFLVVTDYDHPVGALINGVLSKFGSDRRARLIVCEDAPRAWGVYTQEQVRQVASRLQIDHRTGNFTDPHRSRFSQGLQELLGLI